MGLSTRWILPLVACAGRILPAAPSTAMAVRDRSIYVGSSDSKVYRLDAENGRVVDQTQTDAKPFGRLVFNDSSLVMFLEDFYFRCSQLKGL